MLSLEEIKQKIEPVCQKYGVKKVYLFGSYARGEATDMSDIDIRIEKGNIKDLFTMVGFRLDIISALDKEIDLISIVPESKTFKTNINDDEVIIYEN